MSYKFSKFLSDRNIKHITSAIYHPEGNSEIERFNRVLGDCIQTARLECQSVKSAVREFLAIYRCTPHATTGEEPSVLLHTRHMLTKLDIVGVTSSKSSVKDKTMRERVREKQARSKDYVDSRKGAKLSRFKPGDLVRVKKPGYVPKGHSKYCGPFKVKKQIKINTYLLEDGSVWNCERLVPFKACKLDNYTNVDNNNNKDKLPSSWMAGTGQGHRPEPHQQNRHYDRPANKRNRRAPHWHKDYEVNG